MRESGLLKKWTKEQTPTNLHCKGLGPVTSAKEATLNDFQGAFYLLVIGIVCALFLLVGELAHAWRTRYYAGGEGISSVFSFISDMGNGRPVSVISNDIAVVKVKENGVLSDEWNLKQRPLYSRSNTYTVQYMKDKY